MSTALTLDLPWVEGSAGAIEGIKVRAGRASTLAYDDGIVLDVHVIDPGASHSVRALVNEVERSARPGRVVLVAGAVPIEWRATLRDAGVSFFDVSGVAELSWPRIRLSARRFGRPVERQRSALPLQKGHGLVTQELLLQGMEGSWPSIGELASATGVSLSTVSKAVSQLEAHGLVVKHREGTRVFVEVVDRVAVAQRLAERTAWPGDEMLSCYLWGRTVFDVAARLTAAASNFDVDLAVTGRVGAAFLGVFGTSSPKEVRAWVDAGDQDLVDVAAMLELEPSSEDAANVVLSNDRWGMGVDRRHDVLFDGFNASVAHPLRIWCDLHGERRGAEYAAQMWRVVTSGN